MTTDSAASDLFGSLWSRWSRRARTIPTMLGATTAGIIGLPFLALGAVAVDLIRRRPKLPTLRVALFLLQYAVNDSAEVLLAPLLWLMAGFGQRRSSDASQRRYRRVQAWSVAVLAHRAEQLLGLRIDIDSASLSALSPGPVITLCRHVNLIDASLPALLHQRLGQHPRGVIMAELLADPGFDLIYPHTGSVFIPRDDGQQARAILARLVHDLTIEDAIVIFPEGRLFRPERLQRSLTRLAETDPERAERLAGLRHGLPPRPGGVTTLLDLAPDADVVVIAHAGLERFASFRALAQAVPLTEPVHVAAWRFPRTDIPTGPRDRIDWLDNRWLQVDEWVDEHMRRS